MNSKDQMDKKLNLKQKLFFNDKDLLNEMGEPEKMVYKRLFIVFDKFSFEKNSLDNFSLRILNNYKIKAFIYFNGSVSKEIQIRELLILLGIENTQLIPLTIIEQRVSNSILDLAQKNKIKPELIHIDISIRQDRVCVKLFENSMFVKDIPFNEIMKYF